MARSKSKKETEENIFNALTLLEKERNIPVSYMIEKISGAIKIALKKSNNGNDDIDVKIDPEKNIFAVFINKKVVEQVNDAGREISLEDALKINPLAEEGSTVAIEQNPKQFGRIAAQTAKHIIHQGIRDVEKGQALEEFQSRYQEIVTATVDRIKPDTGDAVLQIGKHYVILSANEQIGNENLAAGDVIKVYVAEIKNGDREPRPTISRTHPGMVKRLFENEVPEIFDGTVEIKAVSREAGSRTKMAVWSNDENVDPVGACIGPRGSRVNKVVDELGGEKIDIIRYSEDPAEFIAKALSPAEVNSVEILDEATRSCRVIVPANQLSLAIGNKGQNARLTARLTGWKIDIHSDEDILAEQRELEARTALEAEDTAEIDEGADAEPETEDAAEIDEGIDAEPETEDAAEIDEGADDGAEASL